MNVAPAKKKIHYWLDDFLTPLKQYLDNPAVQEISINKPGAVFIEEIGASHMKEYAVEAMTAETIARIGEQVAAHTGQFINETNPILSASLPTGERIQVVLPPVAPEGGMISIRKQVVNNLTLEEYRDKGALNKVAVYSSDITDDDRHLRELLAKKDIYGFLKFAVQSRVTILVSGGTASGKTTFLNACLQTVGKEERIITLEDTRELTPPQRNVARLVASRGGQGIANIGILELLESSLRMRPDRLFVGEIRGSEAFAFLRAINTGHPGSMATIHADTPSGAYEQLCMMVMQAGLGGAFSKADLMDYIKSVIPIVVQLRKVGGQRGISDILFTRGE
ncbi:type VI secretion protein [Agrobacterium tumefaciens]|uniref:Type IV secretion system protein n=1 Tax=Agrobacterium tumefaciens TaxID=358 RepID=A0A0D0JRU1_AGRTU|nr:type VI secretion protein [Agrobacterium tumefaciens]